MSPYARYCLDEAVSMFGMAIEGALMEMDEVTRGDKTERKPRYTLKQLLDPTFRIPSDNGRGVASGPVHGTGDGAFIVDEVN